jgi:hypothetical protein
MAQVPSTDTIHGPMGLSGVQAFMNRGQSVGFALPRFTSAHLQLAGRS